MKNLIYVIDDIPDLLLHKFLEDKGYLFKAFVNAENAIKALSETIPDLILLDLNLPEKSGFEILREIIKIDEEIPILIVSAKNNPEIKVIGLDLGAVDYICKPFDYNELIARIGVNLRKKQKLRKSYSGKFEFDGFTLDFNQNILSKGNNIVDLTHYEMCILKYLIKKKGEIVSREELISEIWGEKAHILSKTIDNHILRLRKKIENKPKNPKYIITVYGEGYRFKSK